MIEQIRHIKNPLTIVAIFAALAELAGTVSPATIDSTHHGEIVLFLTLFPALLVVLFFLTLWFRPWVLYAPSDFQNEKHFLDMFTEAQRASLELDAIAAQFQDLIKKAVSAAVSSGGAQDRSSERVSEVLNSESAQMMSRIKSARSSLEDYAMSVLPHAMPQSRLQSDILRELRQEPDPLSLSEIRRRIGRDKKEVQKALDRMVQRHIVSASGPTDNTLYTVSV
jgi:DNA-binding MarR family transcriptional regulator